MVVWSGALEMDAFKAQRALGGGDEPTTRDPASDRRDDWLTPLHCQ